MTVEQLIRKLKRLPQDALVVIANDKDYFDGLYEADSVEYDECIVEICTDYKRKVNDE